MSEDLKKTRTPRELALEHKIMRKTKNPSKLDGKRNIDDRPAKHTE